MSQYYTLVAGFRELSLNGENRGFDAGEIRARVREAVSKHDRGYVDLLLGGGREDYYAECARSRCRFLREWSAFDRNLRNVGAALAARRLGLPVSDALVGEGYIVDALSRSAAADFGLRGEVSYVDTMVAAMSEGGNIIEKERAVDRLRWQMADELTLFNYFDIDKVLAYLVKVGILERWTALDAGRGGEILAGMVSGQPVQAVC